MIININAMSVSPVNFVYFTFLHELSYKDKERKQLWLYAIRREYISTTTKRWVLII